MHWGKRYSPIHSDQDGTDSEPMELQNVIPGAPKAVMETRRTGSRFELISQSEEPEGKPPPRKRSFDPVWWCVYGNLAVLMINVIFTICAASWTASHYGGATFGPNILYEGSCSRAKNIKIGIHLVINVLSVVLTATSSFCCNILMSPSRADVDRAHAERNWLTIGVFSMRNFKNLRWPHRMLWVLLTGTSLVVQLIYNSVIYTSLNANTYAALVASHDFVSNTSIPNSAFEAQSCYPEADLAWNITDLRTSILNGEFEVLDPQACIEAYAVEYLSDRRTVIAVPSESMTLNSTRLYMSGYGWPARIYEAIPSNVMQNSGLTGQLNNGSEAYSYSTGDAFSWICAWSDDYQSCTTKTAQSMSPWTLLGQTWTPSTSIQQSNETILDWETVSWTSDAELQYDWSGLNETERAELKTKLEANPTLEQMKSFIHTRTWSNKTFADSLTINASCSTDDWIPADAFMYGAPQRKIAFPIDHCLSENTGGQCRLLYHMPIGVVMIICILLKVGCLFFLVNIDRRSLFLTVGDAISSYLQNPDPLTKGWCMLSKSAVKRSEECPWNASCDPKVRNMPLPPSPRPENPATKTPQWAKACNPLVALGILPILLVYIAITQILPIYAQAAARGLSYGEVTPSQIWDIKGFGSVQSDGLLTNLATTYVGMELLANTPQLLVSLLYFLFNDHMTRMLHTADYNNYAVSRRPLRVSFPQGEQRSTFYLSIPYRYCLPLLFAFTLIHWFISEGIFYVQILPYDLAGNPISSSVLMTCGISTIPLEVAMFLTIAILFVIWFISARSYKCATMPFAIGCSVVISAACHPPSNDPNAAFKPVMWGAVDDKDSDELGHCCFTSLDVTEPQADRKYI
ncbi:hypothetical protein BO78DRAFT_395531 [Aspergillus sclerotiicarbonarius CBS 121057]|uniref:DUF6536 domain-containing protein n=1 Tax=Aspergillus sclerotiicarbonarius (strain CBS 121057 / IBT 28362) TaxID=1448318 RepID=A0A319EEP0_ASPSB|nr:hypothetical protein BO78DRAFT_395531 [Aspergillus sclerotiicarbonarius CBS 121057]